jgi:hypothetical protein
MLVKARAVYVFYILFIYFCHQWVIFFTHATYHLDHSGCRTGIAQVCSLLSAILKDGVVLLSGTVWWDVSLEAWLDLSLVRALSRCSTAPRTRSMQVLLNPPISCKHSGTDLVDRGMWSFGQSLVHSCSFSARLLVVCLQILQKASCCCCCWSVQAVLWLTVCPCRPSLVAHNAERCIVVFCCRHRPQQSPFLEVQDTFLMIFLSLCRTVQLGL